MLVKTFGCALVGIDPITITVEVNVTQGIKFFLVGLPDNAVKESQQRIFSAIQHVKYKVPGKKIIINMAPADIKKEGSAYDLTIAIGILASSGQIQAAEIRNYIIMGELSLDGSLQPLKGALPIALKAKQEGFKGFILPQINAKEAAIVDGINVYGVNNIKEVIDFFNATTELTPQKTKFLDEQNTKTAVAPPDFKEVKGQSGIKRALEIAAAGGHNIILIGPPGSGKTMLAKRVPSILPKLTIEETLETTKIHSVVGRLNSSESILTTRPFRAPHHTISEAALVGGGSNPKPGEISMAHNGVLFLDELPEFSRSALEVLRQPLEDKKITVSRAKLSINFPANFMLIASMNPCPCGYFNHPEKQCVCSTASVQKYLNKISGPLMDRIDLHVEVTPLPFNQMHTKVEEPNSQYYYKKVIDARERQKKRQAKNNRPYTNQALEGQDLKDYCQIDNESSQLLQSAMEKLALSARAYDKIIKIARTIADLDKQTHILLQHVAEAIQYRSLDKGSWFNL